ncbi:MAG TPA: choice-of-anchor D domain-containing protein [Myxococcales bacterium]|nr:choice-of-anchor D domain-containing protein [Myxococcales bacterium]
MGGAKAAVLVAAVGLCASCRQSGLQASDGPAQVKGVDLGTFPLGETAQGNLRISSLGADDIEVSSFALPPEPPAGFSLQGTAPLDVPSGTSVSVPVAFAPTAAGVFDVPVTVNLTPGGAQVAQVTATAVAVQLAVTPQSLAFGKVSLRATATLQLEIDNPSSLAVTASVNVAGSTTFQPGATAVPVPAGGSADVAVAFTPTGLGPATATVEVAACPGCGALDVPASGTGVASVVSVSPPSIAFGNLQVGQSAQQTVTVSNAGNAPLALTSVGTAGTGPFSVAPSGAASVPGGGSLPLAVTFAPGAEGAFQDTLQIATGDPDSPTVAVPLTGSAGAGSIAVLPPSLDFGSVPTGATATQQILIENVGSAAAGVSPLTLSSVSASGAGFTIVAPPSATKLAAGQTITVPVTYAAGAPGSAAGEVDVQSDDPATPLVTVPLAGLSRTVAPCAWSASPAQVDFGLLEPGQQATLSFALENVGSDACVLANLQTVGAPFSLPNGALPQILLQPGDMYDVIVRYAPTATGVDTGDVTFSASSAPPGQVALIGSAAQGCLQITPTDVDFGNASSACPPDLATVSLLDSCSEPVTIDGVSIGRGISSDFSVQPIPLPQTLGAGGTSTLTVAYQPSPSEPDGTPDNAALLIDDGEGQPRTVGLTGAALQSPSQTDTFTQNQATPVDVLIVLDNSASFETQQAGVQQNVNAFLGAALDAGVDFHLGVTTTGIEPATGSWTTCPGGANGGEAGRLFPVDDSSPRILTPQTPNLYAAFDYDTNVGVCHWDEQPFNAAVDALTPPLSVDAKDPGTPWPADGNLGFLRQNALLQILFIQDDDDESVVPTGYTVQTWVDHYVQILKELKGPGNEWMVTASAVTAVPGCNNPQDLGVRYFQLVSEMGGQIWSVCTTDWGATMGQLGAQAFSPRMRFPLSQKPSSPSQITVTVNGQPVPSQDPATGNAEWSYDTTTGELVFTPGYAPSAGAQIQVSYPVACP